jgi:hypothetical protein
VGRHRRHLERQRGVRLQGTKPGAWGFGYRMLTGDFKNDDSDLETSPMSGFEAAMASASDRR